MILCMQCTKRREEKRRWRNEERECGFERTEKVLCAYFHTFSLGVFNFFQFMGFVRNGEMGKCNVKR